MWVWDTLRGPRGAARWGDRPGSSSTTTSSRNKCAGDRRLRYSAVSSCPSLPRPSHCWFLCVCQSTWGSEARHCFPQNHRAPRLHFPHGRHSYSVLGRLPPRSLPHLAWILVCYLQQPLQPSKSSCGHPESSSLKERALYGLYNWHRCWQWVLATNSMSDES